MMAKSDNGYMPRLLDYLRRLEVNNDRAWFQQNREEYDQLRQLWCADVQRLLHVMAQYDPSLAAVGQKDCVYRIYRDTRFSPDKRPYKSYFSAVLAQGGRKTVKACYYLHVQPGQCGLHGGIWCPEMPLLTQLRHEVEDNIDEFLAIINEKEFASRYAFSGQSLKTVPKGFDRNSPHAQYIKMKEYLVSMPLPDGYFTKGDWVERTASDFSHLKPFNDFLNYVFE